MVENKTASQENGPTSKSSATRADTEGVPVPAPKPSLWERIGSVFIPKKRVDAADKHIDANHLAKDRTSLATKRTLMALDRTLMAWVRTALSMISFGFTIYKILQGMQHSEVKVVEASPETVGLFLIGLGTLSMVMGTIEYWYNLKELGAGQNLRLLRPVFVTALIISFAGLGIFISVIAKAL